MMQQRHPQEDIVDSMQMFSAIVVMAYFTFLLLTNQRLVVVTGNQVTISPQQQLTEYSIHVGTAFIASLLLFSPRISAMCQTCR